MSHILKKLLAILSDGQFHSGEQLAKVLGLTQNEICELTELLIAWDLKIESTANQGYRLPVSIALLEKAKILSYVTKEQQDELVLDILDSVPSTNDYLLNLPASLMPTQKIFACLAEKQTQGKGRHGRRWFSPFARNIYLSLLWHFPQDPSKLSGLSLAIAISVVEALKALGISQKLGIKWPNDILGNNQKLAGILIELKGETHNTCKAIIGIGVNVQMANIDENVIRQPWIDLQTLTGKTVNRNELAGLLLNQIIKTLRLFQEQGLKAFLKQWKAFDLTFRKPVSIISANTSYQGIGRGVNEHGHFLLALKPNLIKSFPNGEASLRLS